MVGHPVLGVDAHTGAQYLGMKGMCVCVNWGYERLGRPMTAALAYVHTAVRCSLQDQQQQLQKMKRYQHTGCQENSCETLLPTLLPAS